MNIIELSRKQYQDYELVFEYQTDSHYAVRAVQTANGVNIDIKKEPQGQMTTKRFSENLFQRYLAKPSVYAVMDGDSPAAIIEFDREFWINRLRITDLVVLPQYRRRGYGAALVQKAKEIARKEGFRALFLDTHSCNVPAIDFYLAQGFQFCGVDLNFYSNTDVERGEVWLSLTHMFGDEKSMGWNYEENRVRY